MKISLCILTKNEIQGCRIDVPQINRDAFDEIFAIDGESTDGTVEYLQEMQIPVYKQPQKSYNAACTYAFEKCTTDALIFFHPKASVPVSDTEKFREYFEAGYDLVVASRIAKGGKNEEDHKFIQYRKWFVIFLSLISNVLFRREGTVIWDVLHGFRGMTVKGFNEINPLKHGVTIDLEMVIGSYKKRLKRTEFPTVEKERLAGTTHFRALPTGWNMLKLIYREMFQTK